MKIGDYDSWLKDKARSHPVILVYGPDSGLVHERVQAIIDLKIPDRNDPFQLVRLEGDDLASDPMRLLDEANTISMFGDLRVVWVRAGTKQLQSAVAPVVSDPPAGSLVVIEAGDLKPSAPLRSLCEKAPKAGVIVCYADESRSLAALAGKAFREANIAILPDALQLLLGSLGADRAASRGELDKLILYCRGAAEITSDDVAAIISDVANHDSSSVVDGAFLGEFEPIEAEGTRLFAEGNDAGSLVNAALRHALTLKRLRLSGELGGEGFKSAAAAAGIFFKRHTSVERQLHLWSAARLDRTVLQLGEAVATLRKHPRLAEAIAIRALWAVALAARRR